jgi:colicin import membrane protein
VKRERRSSVGRGRAVLYAVLLHVVVLGLFAVSLSYKPGSIGTGPRESARPVIQARAVDATAVDAEVERLKQAEESKRRAEVEQKRKLDQMVKQAAEAEAKKKRAEKDAAAEEARLAKLKKKQQEEERKAEEAARKRKAEQARAAALKKKQEEAKRKAAAAERKRKAEAQRVAKAKRKQEEERKRKQAEAAAREMQAAMEHERNERRAAALLGGQYGAMIRDKVSRNWNQPPFNTAGLKCVVRVRLTPGGEVVGVKVVQSSGNDIFDRSVRAAVLKSTPLPVPDEPELAEFFREINVDFDPNKG